MAAMVLLLAAWLGKDSAVSAWMRMNGSMVSNGGGTASFSGKPVAMVSVHGTPAGAAVPATALYHVLVIFPGDSATWVTPTSDDSDVAATTHNEWKAWVRFGNGEPVALGRSLDSHYNALLNRVTIRGHRYSLAHGNLFVVRYDWHGSAEVRQLPRQVRDRDPFSVVKLYQALLPGDRAVRDLYRYPKQPCPRRAPSAARVSEA
jgi:hypothetical protein